MADVSEVSDLLGIITKLKGGETSKTTQQTHISDAGVSELVTNILAGPGGVKEIGAATKRAGVFNSTVQEAALNDLYSSAAVKAELARSPTTTEAEMEGGAGIADLAIGLAGTSALSSLMKGEVPFAGVSAKVASLFSGGATPGVSAGAAAPVVDVASSGVTLGTAIPPAGLSGVDVAGTGAASLAEGGSSLLTNGNMLSGGLSILSGLTMGRDASNDPSTLLAAGGAGLLAGGPVGAAISVAGTILGGQLAGSGSFSPMKGIKTGLKSIGKVFGF